MWIASTQGFRLRTRSFKLARNGCGGTTAHLIGVHPVLVEVSNPFEILHCTVSSSEWAPLTAAAVAAPHKQTRERWSHSLAPQLRRLARPHTNARARVPPSR